MYDFNSIAGYKKEKEELIRLCEIINSRDKLELRGAKLPKGVIFYGEAGTGKTLFSKVMASVCNLNVFKINIGDIDNTSHICKAIKNTFKLAKKSKKPAMIFFDELDKVLPNSEEEYYTDQSKVILTQLLTLIDGMDSSNNIIFVATCNDYEVLPETIIRPGRIDKKIGLGNPSFNSKVDILNKYINETNCKFELSTDNIAKLCVGFSCAALETLVNECVIFANDDYVVNASIIQDKILEIKNEDIKFNKSLKEKEIIACRNIGAFIVSRVFNTEDYLLNLDEDTVCNDFFNDIISYYDRDFSKCEDDEDEMNGRKYYSKTELLNTIVVLLGGYVAEEIILHNIYDNIGNYLSIIDRILESMAYNGMFGLSYHFSERRNETMSYLFNRLEGINNKYDEVIVDCYTKAENIIAKNKELIQELIQILINNDFLCKETCENIIQELGGILL